jgi:hypothetical protein
MCSVRLPEDIDWIEACDRYDRRNRFATWFNADLTKSVRYYTGTCECAVYQWNYRNAKWILHETLPTPVHDPIEVKALAERMLHD